MIHRHPEVVRDRAMTEGDCYIINRINTKNERHKKRCKNCANSATRNNNNLRLIIIDFARHVITSLGR